MSNANLNKIAEHWAKHVPEPDAAGFYTSKLLRPYLVESAFGPELVAEYGSNREFAVDAFVDHVLKIDKPIKSILSICCGFGAAERRFMQKLPGVEMCIGLDLSEGALRFAREQAAAEGLAITYESVDLNSYAWPERKFDLVVANGALHHIDNLEGTLEGIKRAMTPGGWLYCCEYVGASRMKHSTRQLELINACAFLVPADLRARKPLSIKNERLFYLVSKAWEIAARGERENWSTSKKIISRLLKKVLKTDPEKFDFGTIYISPDKRLARMDPSEAVRAAEIIPLVNRYFEEVDVRPFGGGILQHSLDINFYDNFDSTNSRHQQCLKTLIEIEKAFMRTDEIGPENAFIFARG